MLFADFARWASTPEGAMSLLSLYCYVLLECFRTGYRIGAWGRV
jgi:hypothetical protein